MTKKELITYARKVAAHLNTADADRVLNCYHFRCWDISQAVEKFGRDNVRAWLRECLPMSENQFYYE